MKDPWKSRLAIVVALAAAGAALLPAGAAAADRSLTDATGDPAPISYRYLARLERGELAIVRARAELAGLAGQGRVANDSPATLELGLEQDNAAYRYRQAIRQQQVDLLQVATQTDITGAVLAGAPPDLAVPLRDTVGAWLAIWHLAGIDEFNLVRIHPHPLGDAAPSATLAGYYQASADHYQIDWTYLASINFIESDFGRINGPSSAGALGPMQFLPSTWKAYGSGGDVNNPKDAIEAAARYLVEAGARRSIDRALFAYNHDLDYVSAVKYYADAIRHDPNWLDRLYYWNTFG